MKKFQIEIEETLQHVYEIPAETLEDAIDIAEERYRNQEYVLYAEDYKGVEFREYKDESIKMKKQNNRESR